MAGVVRVFFLRLPHLRQHAPEHLRLGLHLLPRPRVPLRVLDAGEPAAGLGPAAELCAQFLHLAVPSMASFISLGALPTCPRYFPVCPAEGKDGMMEYRGMEETHSAPPTLPSSAAIHS